MSGASATTVSHSSSDIKWLASWNTLPHGIATGRYTDPAFAKLEFERLWKKVWQVAARVDEIPKEGDFTVYEIVDQSVLIVRSEGGAVKAYHNVCPHRGTALGEGTGSFPSKRIVCSFHGWCWNLKGQNQFVLERHEFRGGQLRDSDVALREINVEVFAGFIFVNLDPNPEPFDKFIAPIRGLLESLAIDQMRHYWWKAIPIASNWKVAQEAFFEGYHIPATHPQLEPHSGEFIYNPTPGAAPDFAHWNIEYEVFERGHGRFYGKKSPIKGDVKHDGDLADAMAARLDLLAEGMDAMVLKEDIAIARALKGKPIPEGSSVGGEYVKALYASAAAQRRPMPAPTAENIGMWGGEVFIFPNVMIMPQGGNALIYRSRPHATDPDRCTFEILSTRSYPAAVEPPRATLEVVNDASDPDQLRQIPRQDLHNIPRMQKGLHSIGIRHIYLASHQEKMILNMHQELDRYLKTSPPTINERLG